MPSWLGESEPKGPGHASIPAVNTLVPGTLRRKFVLDRVVASLYVCEETIEGGYYLGAIRIQSIGLGSDVVQ